MNQILPIGTEIWFWTDKKRTDRQNGLRDAVKTLQNPTTLSGDKNNDDDGFV